MMLTQVINLVRRRKYAKLRVQFFSLISDSDQVAVIENNVLKLLRPLDREVQNEVRLAVYCNVTRTDNDVINGRPQQEIVRNFRKQVIIQVEDVNDEVRIIGKSQ